MNIFILAAGLGTRLKPLTDTMPKALVPVGGRPLLQILIEKIKRECTDPEIVINIHHFGQQIIDFVESHQQFGLPITFSDERDQLLETGGGLKQAAPLFHNQDPILIHNVDILSNVDLGTFYHQHSTLHASPSLNGQCSMFNDQSSMFNDQSSMFNGQCSMVNDLSSSLIVSPRTTKRYLLFNDDTRLVGWTNVETGEVRSPYPDLDVTKCHRYAFSGIHIISQSLLPLMDTWPARFPIIDFYLSVCDRVVIRADVRPDLQLLDVGKLDSLSQAEAMLPMVEP